MISSVVLWAEIAGFAEAFGGAYAEVAPVLDERVRRLLLGSPP